jgi:hypothetical protein
MKIQETSKKGEYYAFWSWANSDKSPKGWNLVNGIFDEKLNLSKSTK